MCAHKLSKEEHADALPYLMFLKQKRTGIIQGHRCCSAYIWQKRRTVHQLYSLNH